ncbi:MAG: hypothetical protein CSA22_00870 [Deltaproteobacteria bacterium]|nr:MAG: hypothetical protein CSA22_00870 [Deltaproteobacteria bacterium]
MPICVWLILTAVLLAPGSRVQAAKQTPSPPVTTLETWDPSQPDAPGSVAPDTLTDIHDIRPPVEVTHYLSFVLAGLLGVLILLLLVTVAVLIKRWLQNKGGSTAGIPVIPPDEEALSALDALDYTAVSNVKNFYFRLSELLRRYLERVFAFHALEMTTEELLPKLSSLALAHPHKQMLSTFFKQSDPIRYAGALAAHGQPEQDWAAIRAFIIEHTAACRVASEPGIDPVSERE